MLATELLFVYAYCLVDDEVRTGVLSIPRRPGPAPACTDAELLTIAVVRHLLGRRSENGFLAEISRDWLYLFPRLPDQSEVNRRTRWLWGAFEQFRAAWAAAVPADPVQQIDTSALPVKHPSRVRGPDGWAGPGNGFAARFGRDGAHAEWFYGLRLAIRTDLGRRIVRAWSIVPAAVDERQVGADLVTGAAAIGALLQGKGVHRPPVHRRDGRCRNRADHPAHPGAAPDHANDAAAADRPVPQPGGNLVQGDHRPDGTRPARRAYLRRTADQDRRDPRRPHPATDPARRSELTGNTNPHNAPKVRAAHQRRRLDIGEPAHLRPSRPVPRAVAWQHDPSRQPRPQRLPVERGVSHGHEPK
jgi:hypothetical protein